MKQYIQAKEVKSDSFATASKTTVMEFVCWFDKLGYALQFDGLVVVILDFLLFMLLLLLTSHLARKESHRNTLK